MLPDGKTVESTTDDKNCCGIKQPIAPFMVQYWILGIKFSIFIKYKLSIKPGHAIIIVLQGLCLNEKVE